MSRDIKISRPENGVRVVNKLSVKGSEWLASCGVDRANSACWQQMFVCDFDFENKQVSARMPLILFDSKNGSRVKKRKKKKGGGWGGVNKATEMICTRLAYNALHVCTQTASGHKASGHYK